MNFKKNLTLLYSSHLEVFLLIFYFLNLNLIFEFGLVGYRPKPEPAPTGFFNPASLPLSLCFLNVSLVSEIERKKTLSCLARDLPSLAATPGRAAAQPFAGDERILQVCRARPFSFLVLCETEHPKP